MSSSLVRCESCGSPNSAVSTSCSTCGAPRAARQTAYEENRTATSTRWLGTAAVGNSDPLVGPRAAVHSPIAEPYSLGPRRSDDPGASYAPPATAAAYSSTSSAPETPSRLPTTQKQQQQQQSILSGADPSTKMLAAMFPLIGASEDGKYSEGQVKQLMEVIEASQQYGKEIEQSVEELAELLRNKTLECDGLRQLARQNYDPLRQAVKQEYNARVKQESRHAQEQRKLQQQLEALRNERTKLQEELESLRQLVRELQSVPPPVDFDARGNTVLHRMLRAGSGSSPDPYGRAQLNVTSSGKEQGALWLPHDTAMTIPEQRDLVNLILNLNADQARQLHRSGCFDFVRVLSRRICTPLPDGTLAELGVVVGDMLRELRSGTDFAAEAAQPMPVVQVPWRQRVTQLFLANNPGKGQQLAVLLDDYRGREEALYHKLKEEYDTANRPLFDEVDDGSATNRSVSQRLGYQSALDAKAGAAQVQPVTKSNAVQDRELHARCIIMYKKYNPTKATSKEVQELLRKYPPEVLLAALVEKYGPEPTAAERKHLVRTLMEESERIAQS